MALYTCLSVCLFAFLFCRCLFVGKRACLSVGLSVCTPNKICSSCSTECKLPAEKYSRFVIPNSSLQVRGVGQGWGAYGLGTRGEVFMFGFGLGLGEGVRCECECEGCAVLVPTSCHIRHAFYWWLYFFFCEEPSEKEPGPIPLPVIIKWKIHGNDGTVTVTGAHLWLWL